MKRVAYLTGRTYAGEAVPAGGVPAYDKGDFDLLRGAAQRLGVWLEPAFWDDGALKVRGFEAAIVRSCWDYTQRPEAFLDQMDAHQASGVRVLNAPDLLRWNARKTYLRQLEHAGVPTIDTIWVDGLEAGRLARAFEDLDAAELVVKPQLGASGEGALRLKRNTWSAGDLVLGPQGPAMIQPFLQSVQDEGEVSLLYFGGALAYAIRKKPRAGRWSASDPDARFTIIAPPPGAREVAEMALNATPGDVLYARVDLLKGPGGDWRINELELIEPYFFLVFAPAAADFFARGLVRTLSEPFVAPLASPAESTVLPRKRQRSRTAQAGQSGTRA